MASDASSSAGSGSLDLPPSSARRIRRGSVAMSINLIVAAVILGGGSIVEAIIGLNNYTGPNRSWAIYFGVLPALLMVVLALRMLRIRDCLDGDRLDLDALGRLRPSLRLWWIAVVGSALLVIVVILLVDFMAHTSSSGYAIFGALPPFLAAVVTNTSYGASKGWLNPPDQLNREAD
jgi:drug/metabolite transporter (DMT)-like permease